MPAANLSSFLCAFCCDIATSSKSILSIFSLSWPSALHWSPQCSNAHVVLMCNESLFRLIFLPFSSHFVHFAFLSHFVFCLAQLACVVSDNILQSLLSFFILHILVCTRSVFPHNFDASTSPPCSLMVTRGLSGTNLCLARLRWFDLSLDELVHHWCILSILIAHSNGPQHISNSFHSTHLDLSFSMVGRSPSNSIWFKS